VLADELAGVDTPVGTALVPVSPAVMVPNYLEIDLPQLYMPNGDDDFVWGRRHDDQTATVDEINPKQLDLLKRQEPTNNRLKARAAVDTSNATPLRRSSMTTANDQAGDAPWWVRWCMWLWQLLLTAIVKKSS